MLKRTRAEDVENVKIGEMIKIQGWVERIRDFGNVSFGVVRDSSGYVQVTWARNEALLQEKEKNYEEFRGIPMESVVSITGSLQNRPEKEKNPKQKNGEVELVVSNMEILNLCRENLPLSIHSQDIESHEQTRLKYRYLDLRRRKMQKILAFRSSISHCIRSFLISRGFMDVETPTLFKPTPEGAREFIVPTQTPGKYFALPQSPQQCKQLLMAAGVEKYFQFARCYRNEPLRSDRQPEFTQIDLEMAFSDEETVIQVIEDMFLEISDKIQVSLEFPFRRLSYNDAIHRYGTDKPDLRYGMEIADILPYCEEDDIFVHALNLKGLGKALSRKEVEILKKTIVEQFPEAKSAYLIKVKEDGKWKGPQFLSEHRKQELETNIDLKYGDLMVIMSGINKEKVLQILGSFRTHGARKSQEIGILEFKGKFSPAWICNFPLFEFDGDTIQSVHHPFTAPVKAEEQNLRILIENRDKLCTYDSMSSRSYDLVINGYEIGGGSVRIHDASLQEGVLDLLGSDRDEFQHLIDALSLGCPPHAGIALGLDRLISVLCETDSIRDTIAFPKSSQGSDLMTGAPGEIDRKTLLEYNL
eukprot:CAMPEP_0167741754 /NCGR_PEP_ID=MMETSP0110_2-20121227/1033_1 /TAXON_ID=629695 /ORGANISM="Gymnochlora sp., Strain CCMP2014" /LENGTH=585 /DNA_ID=CAMNT_0007625843 /DNA_START=54 /DNA_END=1811 /DNA_ORIENTATION=+